MDKSFESNGPPDLVSVSPATTPSRSSILSPYTSYFNYDSRPSPRKSIPSRQSVSSHSSCIPPSPSRRLDSEYSSRLVQPINKKSNSNIPLPPGIRRSRGIATESFPLDVINTPHQKTAQNRKNGDATGNSEHSSNLFFTPERSSLSMSTPRRLGMNKSPLRTPSSVDRRILRDRRDNPSYSDRFIPSRATSSLDLILTDRSDHNGGLDNSRANSNRGDSDSPNNIPGVNQLDGEEIGASPGTSSRGSSDGNSSRSLMNALLRSELLGQSTPGLSSPSHSNAGVFFGSPGRDTENYFCYQSQRQIHTQNVGDSTSSVIKAFSLSPVANESSNRLLAIPQKRKRKIGKVPFKVLDACQLQDDFYLNLVDWSSQNVLAVGLGSCVYLWSACTSKVTKLCDLSSNDDSITSVSWTQRGTHLAVGTNKGEVQIWDTVKCIKIRTMGGHSARIGSLAWNGTTLASGSRDRLISLRDVRMQQSYISRLACHKQEVCGLKWSFDEPSQLASGGNDNKLLIWDLKNHSQPVHKFAEHTAAVKAIAWSPHQHGLLTSGGGTADRCIRFWNTQNGTALNCIDTGSQVCNLAWSKNCNEIVSTHGYSLNQIVVWRYPTMQKVTTLVGHTFRVLYLSMSPDGSTIVTGAGDETLRFWQVFPGPRSHNKNSGNRLLFPVVR